MLDELKNTPKRILIGYALIMLVCLGGVVSVVGAHLDHHSSADALINRLDAVLQNPKSKPEDLKPLFLPISDIPHCGNAVWRAMLDEKMRVTGSRKLISAYSVHLTFKSGTHYYERKMEITEDVHGKWYVSDIKPAKRIATD